jgi:hypothetical protein
MITQPLLAELCARHPVPVLHHRRLRGGLQHRAIAGGDPGAVALGASGAGGPLRTLCGWASGASGSKGKAVPTRRADSGRTPSRLRGPPVQHHHPCRRPATPTASCPNSAGQRRPPSTRTPPQCFSATARRRAWTSRATPSRRCTGGGRGQPAVAAANQRRQSRVGFAILHCCHVCPHAALPHSPPHAATACTQTLGWLQNLGLSGILFETFQEPWKALTEGYVGPYWGECTRGGWGEAHTP